MLSLSFVYALRVGWRQSFDFDIRSMSITGLKLCSSTTLKLSSRIVSFKADSE